MPITTEVRTVDGRPIVVKRAGPLEAPRLRAEAARLAAARHPGVVEVLGDGPHDDGWELRSLHAGPSLDARPPHGIGEVAALGAGVAATLADLHELGVVHGRLAATHVLVGPGGRPVLCGFGSSQEGVTPADDVAALGALLTELAGTDGEVEPIPDRRWRRPRPWDGWEKRALLTLADQAAAEPPTRRPTARRLAAALRELAPGPSAPRVEATQAEADDDDPDPHAADPMASLRPGLRLAPPRTRPRAAALLLVGVVLVVVGRAGWSGDPADTASGPPVLAPRSTSLPPTTTTEREEPSAGPPACGPVDGVDLDGDGCREPVTVEGTTVRIGAMAFAVGEVDDHIEVGDWDCDGDATLALLRPATGDVFLFAGWVTSAAVTVDPSATVPGAVELVRSSAPSGCRGLAVRTRSGALVDVVRAGTA